METKTNDFFMWLGDLCDRTIFGDKWNDRLCWTGIGLVVALFTLQAIRYFLS